MYGKIISSGISLGIMFVLVTGCSKPAPPKMPPASVIVEPIGSDKMSATQRYVGKAVAYDEVDLVARVEGFLEQRNFSEGMKVKKGDLLFLIEQDNYTARVDAATALLREMEANLRNANSEYSRHKHLQEKDANSKRDFEQAETNKMVAEAKLLAAKANLENAKLNLRYTEIRAPFDGRMGMSNYSVGNMVGPTSGKLAMIVKNDVMKVDFYVSEATITSHMQDRVIVNHKNEQVIPSLLLPNGRTYPLTGTLESLDNKINDGTGTVMVRAVFPNPDNLLIPGMYVKVILVNKAKEKTLKLPAVALQEDQEGSFVMVVDAKNTVHLRHVEVDTDQSGMVLPIKSGLSEGELVVVEGLQKIKDGDQVTPNRKDAVAATPAPKTASQVQ